MDFGELHARRYDADGLLLGRQYEFVDVALLRGEAAVDGPRAGDVRAVVVDLRPGVDQEQVAVPDLAAVRYVVEDARVPAGRDDGRVAVSWGPQTAKLILQRRLDVVLPEAGTSRPNRAVEPLRGDINCLLEGVDLFGGLDDPPRPDRSDEVDDATDVAAVALAARTTPDDEVGNETVEASVRAERVVHRAGLGQELGELFVQLFDREGLVGSQSLLRAFDPDSLSGPIFRTWDRTG